MERALPIPGGLTLAGLEWNNTDTEARILCLHGWMDNAASFTELAPSLPGHVMALDLLGHGKSSHSTSAPTVLAEYVYYVHAALDALDWKDCILVGHSMGAAVGCMMAASFPERIQKLVLLEGAGPLARPVDRTSQHVRAYVTARSKEPKIPRVYPSLELAVKTRCQTALSWPGNQWLSEEASRRMVERGSRPVEGGVQFTHDPRLQWPSLLFMTQEQVNAVYRDIQCPTAMILAESGWPFDPSNRQTITNLLQPQSVVTLPGSHHFHADPDTSQAVLEHVLKFLE